MLLAYWRRVFFTGEKQILGLGVGGHLVRWNGNGDDGLQVSSGVYLVRLTAGKSAILSVLCY